MQLTLMKCLMNLNSFMLIMLIFMIITIKYLNSLTFMITFILFTFIMMINNYMNFNISMYMYMIFISFIGSMMIMFLYFTSIINNQKSKFIVNKFYFTMILLILTSTMIWPAEMNNFNLMFNFKSIYKIYLYPMNIITTLTIIYLLLIMNMTMKMCSNKYMPLRKMKN